MSIAPRWQTTLKEYVEALLIAVILALFVRAFIVQAFKIPSGSMLQTLQIGDHLLVNKIGYGIKIPFTHKFLAQWGEIKHGDVIVFEFPKNQSVDYIKRVIGVPGDTIEIKDNVLYRNGEAVDEPYIKQPETRVNVLRVNPKANFGPITVPEDNYFVLGDNRDNSKDSRYWGYVPRELVIGKAWIIFWSWRSWTDVRWGRIGDVIH